MDVLSRYQRQIPVVGLKGQKQLAETSALVVGCGGIGSPVLYYLAASGCGRIGMIDDDRVELSNLHRQILFDESCLNQSKAFLAKKRLGQLNSAITLEAFAQRLTLENARSLFANYDLIIDGSDNFATRYLVNDVCCALNKPFISASILKYVGQVGFFNIQTGCYRCLFREPPPPDLAPNCAEAGVTGAVAGTIGSMAVSMAIDVMIGRSQQHLNCYRVLDLEKMDFKKFSFAKVADCPACVQKIIQQQDTAMTTCNLDVPIQNFQQSPQSWYVVDVREDWEREQFHIEDHAHIPLGELESRVQELPRAKLLFYCAGGIRSKQAALLVKNLGFEAYSLVGGMRAWRGE